MTVWKNTAKKPTDKPLYIPKRHNPERQLWRDFSSLIAQRAGGRSPGVVNWLTRLKAERYLPRLYLRFQTAGVKYGDKDFFVEHVFGDTIAFNSGLLMELNTGWVTRIIGEIETADMLVEQAGKLAQNLAKSAGDHEGKAGKDYAMTQAYYRLDSPFRNWLENIDPVEDVEDIDEKCLIWWETAQRIIRSLGRELIMQTGSQAFIGRNITESKTVKRYTAPEAYNSFIYFTSSIEALKKSKGGKKNG